MSCPNRPCRNGFTLMELLVALAITGIIAVTLFSMLSTTVSNWRKAELRMNEAFRTGNLYVLLSTKLEGYLDYDSKTEPGLYFEAGPAYVRFISYETMLFPYFPVVTELSLSEGELKLTETPFFWDRIGIPDPESRDRVIAEDVKELEISYLVVNSTKRNDPGEWVTEYDVKDKVQRAEKIRDIRFTVRWADGREMIVSHPLRQQEDDGARTRF